jgi:hypothetical protein
MVVQLVELERHWRGVRRVDGERDGEAHCARRLAPAPCTEKVRQLARGRRGQRRLGRL